MWNILLVVKDNKTWKCSEMLWASERSPGGKDFNVLQCCVAAVFPVLWTLVPQYFILLLQFAPNYIFYLLHINKIYHRLITLLSLAMLLTYLLVISIILNLGFWWRVKISHHKDQRVRDCNTSHDTKRIK